MYKYSQKRKPYIFIIVIIVMAGYVCKVGTISVCFATHLASWPRGNPSCFFLSVFFVGVAFPALVFLRGWRGGVRYFIEKSGGMASFRWPTPSKPFVQE